MMIRRTETWDVMETRGNRGGEMPTCQNYGFVATHKLPASFKA